MKPIHTRLTAATLLGFTLLISGCSDSGTSGVAQSTNAAAQTALKTEAQDEVITDRGQENTIATGTLARIDTTGGDITMERCMSQRRYLVFHTNEALDAVNDTNGTNDVYLRDLRTGTIKLISKNRNGKAGNGPSTNAILCSNADRIVYQSQATDLVPGDTNSSSDIFEYDGVSETVGNDYTTRVSLDINGGQAAGDSSFPAANSDGTQIAFLSKADLTGVGTNGIQNLYLRKLGTNGATKLFSRGSGTGANGHIYTPVMTNDSRFVAFSSAATNLVAGDTNNSNDIFLFDRTTGLIERVSLDSAGQQVNGSSSMPSISDNGNLIAFDSKASNLVASDSNGLRDVFVRNRASGTTTRASVDGAGAQSNGISYHSTLSRDGSHIAFASQANNLVPQDTNNVSDVFQRELTNQASIKVVSYNQVGAVQGDAASDLPSFDSDNNSLSFRSSSSNLDWANQVSGNEIFLAHLKALTVEVVGQVAAATNELGSVGSSSYSSGSSSEQNIMSADGRYVVFSSRDSGLVASDTNNAKDIFVRDRVTAQTRRVSVITGGGEANGNSSDASISADGRFVIFRSAATNLVAADSNGVDDIFLHNLLTGETSRISQSGTVEPNGRSLAPSISGDGRYQVFISMATNLSAQTVNLSAVSGPSNAALYIRDRVANSLTKLSVPYWVDNSVTSYGVAISADGSTITFINAGQLYAYDIASQTATPIGLSSTGATANAACDQPSISADGRFVAFCSSATNLADAEAYRRLEGAKYAASFYFGSLAAFGQIAAPSIPPSPQVPGAFVRDRQTGTTTLIGGTQAGSIRPLQKPETCSRPSISADGRFVRIHCSIQNQYPYSYLPQTQESRMVDLLAINQRPVYLNGIGSLSPDGRFTAFSTPDSLTASDVNAANDVYVSPTLRP